MSESDVVVGVRPIGSERDQVVDAPCPAGHLAAAQMTAPAIPSCEDSEVDAVSFSLLGPAMLTVSATVVASTADLRAEDMAASGVQHGEGVAALSAQTHQERAYQSAGQVAARAAIDHACQDRQRTAAVLALGAPAAPRLEH